MTRSPKSSKPPNPLLEQFLSEARELLEGIAAKLLQLENAASGSGPNSDPDRINELFRMVHTLKGNSGLFAFPEMTRVLHAAEDLMGLIRGGQLPYSRELADPLLDAMDFVGTLCDDIEASDGIDPARAPEAVRLAGELRALMQAQPENPPVPQPESFAASASGQAESGSPPASAVPALLAEVPEERRMAAFRRLGAEDCLHWIAYKPAGEAFFQGDDPLHTARRTPELIWGRIRPGTQLPPLAEFDTYRSLLQFDLLSAAPQAELAEYFRYIPDQVEIEPLPAESLILPQGSADAPEHASPENLDFLAGFASFGLDVLNAGDLASLQEQAETMLERARPASLVASALRWLVLVLECQPGNRAAARRLLAVLAEQGAPASSAATGPDAAGHPVEVSSSPAADGEALEDLYRIQAQILALPDRPLWHPGRLRAAAGALANLARAEGDERASAEVEAALATALDGDCAPLLRCAEVRQERLRQMRAHPFLNKAPAAPFSSVAARESLAPASDSPAEDAALHFGRRAEDFAPKFGRRAEDAAQAPKTLKVDQAKIDRLMNLIGELIVAKNALPYLAQRAESQFGVRELAREIKAQHAVVNRIGDEMQDAILQVRMMAVSIVFQRFPRLVRDISKKLGKEVQLVLEGEQTEADKNIVEALADPLIHIVRNSLDHGLETPEARRAAGKPAVGTLKIRAVQEADKVLIEISDDGKGIDPAVVKRKAYERGLIDEAALERMGDQQAIELIFAAGLSTAEAISDLSGRGVGMDAVRSAVEKINGTVALESAVGKGTTLRISLPLSMAVTQVMVVESDNQLFGVPMDHILETVRIPSGSIRSIKRNPATVLRGRLVPLKPLNALLGLAAKPKRNADDELAVLLVRSGSDVLGLLVDGFRESIGLIQKPLAGMLSGLSAYSGSALLGDGSVLMILNIREIL